jgi:hypothetical protein
MSLRIRVTRFLLPIRMQKCPSVNTHNIFQSNFRIAARSFLNYLPTSMRYNLHIVARNFLNCPSIGIYHNLGIIVRNSLSYSLASIHHNLCIATHSSLSCPPTSIRYNLRITARNSSNCPLVGICCTLLLRSSSVPLPGKTISTNARVFQRGLLFLFVHWFNEGWCVEGGEIGEKVRSVGKVTKETRL